MSARRTLLQQVFVRELILDGLFWIYPKALPSMKQVFGPQGYRCLVLKTTIEEWAGFRVALGMAQQVVTLGIILRVIRLPRLQFITPHGGNVEHPHLVSTTQVPLASITIRTLYNILFERLGTIAWVSRFVIFEECCCC